MNQIILEPEQKTFRFQSQSWSQKLEPDIGVLAPQPL